VRVLQPAPRGFTTAIRDAWERYGLPIALTEVHLGCTREEQLRWLTEALSAAVTMRKDGVDLRAVTAWALFGNRGWNTLLTSEGSYEPGAFDCGGRGARRTAVGALVANAPVPPVTRTPGWWRRDERLLHAPAHRVATVGDHVSPAATYDEPLLVLGA